MRPTDRTNDMIELITSNVAEIMAGCALLLAISANRIAYQAKSESREVANTAAALYKAERRTEHLVQLERKNAAQSRLQYIIVKRIKLYKEHPELEKQFPGDVERLFNNLNLVTEQLNQSRHIRDAAEQALAGDNQILHEEAFTDIKRLTVKVEKDIETEQDAYNELLRRL